MNEKSDSNIFQPIIQELSEKDIALYGPESFQQYGRKHHFEHLKSKTAQYISVDFIERLNPALKANDAMIFRLGTSTDGRTTNFAVIKVKNHLQDFFFFDKDVFSSNEPYTFLPSTSMKKFYPFLLLPWRSESSLLNLGLASGLIGHALNLDCTDDTIVPATTQSTFSFKFNPHRLIDCELIHQNGQVEIDGLIATLSG